MTVMTDAGAELCIDDEMTWLTLAEAESLSEMCAWNGWTFAKWDALTGDQQWKKTHFTAAKWKWKTMHCNGGPPQYSFDPAAPDYAGLNGEAAEE